ncbi:MAG: AAA family ATPase [Muribaculaceae bacterium]|nr:AAA family ATPase [Muribaculaceae bacterium]
MKSTNEQKTNIVLPITAEGTKAFLASGAVSGIGKIYAGRLVDKYGPDVVEMIMNDPASIKDVQGVGEARLLEAANSLKQYDRPLDLALGLYSAGVPDLFVDRIFGKYKKRAGQVIESDPYSMVEDVWRLSFFTADKIGHSLKIADDDSRRLRGALVTAVKHFAENGHLFATPEEAIEYASGITGVPKNRIEEEIPSLIEQGRLISDKGGLYLPVFHKAEVGVAEKLREILTNPKGETGEFEIPESDISGHKYTPVQREAIEMALKNPVSVITGGPGSGKTTVLKGILDVLIKTGKKIVLVAPTGRAAKRMSTLTGMEASTIHRLLGYRQGEGYRTKKIEADVIIIDEGSMLEQVMLNHLLDAVGPETRLIIVGDVDQLPSIGAGDVLRDLILSGKVPTVILTENFRQAKGSLIADGARRINRGGYPVFDDTRNFMFIETDSPKQIYDRIINLVATELPEKYGIRPIDILVVTPQQLGDLGVKHFNVDLQKRLNPVGPAIKRGETILRLGDPVMQTSNSTIREIYNGETGIISEVDEQAGSLTVKFSDGKTSTYSGRETGELVLAYATSVHKLQGSEIKNMVMPITMEHKPMLYRNLIYTAISRAKDLCVLVGQPKALEYAISNNISGSRNSNFKHRL